MRRAKGGRQRVVPIHPALAPLFAAYYATRVNLARSPRPNYLILHRSTCRTISGQPTRGGPWTGPYIKVCSDDELQIAAWTGKSVGAAPTRCGICLR